MFQREFKALPLLVSLADGLASDHHDVLENLLGEIPMLGGGTTTNISRGKERG